MTMGRNRLGYGLIISLTVVSVSGCGGAAVTAGAPPAVLAVQNLTGGDGFKALPAPFIAHPKPSAFTICHGNTCRLRSRVALLAPQWKQVRSAFQPVATSAEQERQQMAVAVAILERIVGDRIGTSADKAQNDGGATPGQMDCIDESTNTTVYLTMMYGDGLLKWHDVGGRATRMPPHSVSVIRDKSSGMEYAVDSWFLANGEPPFVVPMTQWRAGWRPSEQDKQFAIKRGQHDNQARL
ncbi:MAG: hypothetical protein U1F34_05265 [Gammaproteobacteria bacterium]